MPPTTLSASVQILIRAGRAYADTWNAQKLDAKRRELRGETDEPEQGSAGSDKNLKQDFKDLAGEFGELP